MLKKLLPRRSASRWLGSETELELEKHFTVTKKLGKGSFATVYQARRRADQKDYALKVADVRALGPEEQADVVNEIRLLASLSHPNLTTFYEAFCDHGKLCLVLELVGGGDLGSLIKKRAATGVHFSQDQVMAAFLQVALGLQYLHHSHVLHRDLKPSNLLLTERGVVKLADLGISQLLDRVFASAMIGTPHYMPPEMWRHQPYSYSADMWALGCILHELCTLRPLFLGGSDAEVKQKVLAGAVPPISPRYSEELRGLVAGMLRHSPAQRPTIDDILQTPLAQLHLAKLPEELQERCISPALSWERSQARLVQPLAVPRSAEGWERMNRQLARVLPPRYLSGPGVASALGGKQKSWSTGDLQALAATAEAEEEEEAGGAGSGGAVPPPPPAAEAAAAIRKTQSYGSLAAAVEAQLERSGSSLARRKSVSVGELLQSPEGSVRGGGVAGGLGPALGLHSRHRSSHGHGLASVTEDAPGEAAAGPAAGVGPPQLPSAARPPLGPAAPSGGAGGAVEEEAAARQLRTFRSKSLSVEDAIDSLAAQQPQPAMQQGLLRAAKAPARLHAAAMHQPIAAPSSVGTPAAAPALPSSSAVAPRGVPSRGVPLPAQAAGAAPLPPPPATPQPAAPLPSPAVTAQVQLQKPPPTGVPASSGKAAKQRQQQTEAAAAPAVDGGSAAGAGRPDKKPGGGKKAHFWQHLKGGRK